MKKRYIIFSFIFLFILFRFTYIWLSKGRNVSYHLKKEGISFDVIESYTRNYKNDYPNYYIEINDGKDIFNFEIPDIFSGNSYIVEDVKYFKNSTYTCLLPIFNNGKIVSDILCLKEGTLYHYDALQNESLELDKFASSIDRKFIKTLGSLKMKNLKVYTDNIDNKAYVILSNYHGIDIIHSKRLESVSLFDKDIYTQRIKVQVGKYYVVADYNQTHDFHEFYRVDVTTKKVTKIISESSISLDSYIQGVVGNIIYLFDKDSKKQYKIDVVNQTVTVNGTVKTGIQHYRNGEFIDINAYEAYTNELLFDIYPIQKIQSSNVVKVGNKYSGYNYMYTPLPTGEYDVYHFHVQSDKLKTYAFTTTDIERLYYTNSGLYYIDKNVLYYYNPLYGVKPLLENNEWNYNSSLSIYVYQK